MPDDSYSIYSTKYIVLNILHAVILICQSIMQMKPVIRLGQQGYSTGYKLCFFLGFILHNMMQIKLSIMGRDLDYS